MWCQTHGMTWSATRREGADFTVILEPQSRPRSWQRMRLVMDQPDLRLEDERGVQVASASDLPSLLDAIDGGVADLD